MNCQNFETVVGDLARGVPLEARAQAEARAHEAACAPCAARLADEGALSAGLRGLAASTEAAAAPPRVEANLLAAFRARAVERVGPALAQETAAPSNVLTPTRPAALRRWSWAKTFGAAAAAAAAAVTLVMLVPPPPSAPPPRAETRNAPGPSVDFVPPVAPAAVLAPAETAGADARVGAGSDSSVVGPRPPHAPRVAAIRAGGRAAVYQHAGGRAPQAARRAAPRVEEIATDFIPLTQDARFAASEGGQVVRVELPRTALQRFGLPMNVERAGVSVKADVLLGHDGVARAIRFVQ